MGKRTGISVYLRYGRFVSKYYNLPKTCRHTQVNNLGPLMNAAKLREATRTTGGFTVPLPLPCGISLLQHRSKQHKLELCKGLTGGQSAKRAFGDFFTIYIVESLL